MQDRRHAGGEGARQEGHDFPRLGEGGPAACRWGWGGCTGTRRQPPVNAVGEGRGRFFRIGNRSGPRTPHLQAARRRRGRSPASPYPPRNPGRRPRPPAVAPLTCSHRCMRGAPSPGSRVGRGREGGPRLPPTPELPSPGRLRRRRGCPLLQCESRRRRRRAGPGPGRPGNRDSTWRGAARGRAHPPAAPPGAAPPAQPRHERRRLVAASPPRSPDPPAPDSGCRSERERSPTLGASGGGADWECGLWV